MGEYSPIKRMYIKNFRNLDDVQIDFGESPIIALVGDNDAGKSSVLKAFEVCALHYNTRKQKEYIRTGTQFFGVVIELADGTTVIRQKTPDVNKYEVRYPDKETWSTMKVSEGLPVQVSEVMGMIEEPETKEYLQVRTYEDQLLLVYTPSSTNYKVMYDALKVGQITRAVKNGKDEANACRAEIMENYTKIRALDENIRRIKVMDISSAVDIRESMKKLRGTLTSIKEAVEVRDRITNVNSELGTLKLIDTFGLDSINEVVANMMVSAYNMNESKSDIVNKLSYMGELDSLEIIDDSTIKLFEDALRTRGELKKIEEELERLGGIADTEEVSEVLVTSFTGAMSNKYELTRLSNELAMYNGVEALTSLEYELEAYDKFNSTIAIIKSINESNETLRKLSEQIAEGDKYLRDKGVTFETCPNCGTEVLVDYSKL